MPRSRNRLALIGLALVYATLLANAFISYLNIRSMYDNDRWVIHTFEAIHAINVLYFAMTDVEAAQRGFVSTGEASYSEQFENSLVQVHNALHHLAQVVVDNPRRAPDISKLERQVARKLDAAREIVAARQSSGREAAEALMLMGESRRAMEALRQTVTRLEFDEQRLLVDRQTQSDASYKTAIISGGVASALGVCLSILATVLVWRDIETHGKNAANLRLVNDQLARQAEQLAGVNQSLEAEIVERVRAEDTLHQADQLKDQFLATLAHELRNPLAPLLSAAQLLALQPNPDSETKEMTAVMLRQVEQLKRLIDDLLDVSRISRGKLQLKLEPVVLGDAVAAALDVCRPLAKSKRHELVVTMPEQPVAIQGDLARLTQIMGNLLMNAAKFTPPGGRIELCLERAESQVEIRVRDNGIGLAPEMLPRVFDMFIQVDPTNQRSQGGLGIGLSLAKTLVEMHGGSIQVSSAGLGQGSEFFVTVPLPDQPALPIPATGPRAPSADWPTLRFLIVDDNQSASYLLGKLLEKLGQQVHVAPSAETALALFAQWQPQVVISDIAMPEVSGYELAERICRLPAVPRPLLIALTGYGQESDRLAALAAGFEEHLTKPIGMPALQALLERIATRFDAPSAVP